MQMNRPSRLLVPQITIVSPEDNDDDDDDYDKPDVTSTTVEITIESASSSSDNDEEPQRHYRVDSSLRLANALID